ncbi:MAG: GyrI-like domain-containing protein [Rhodocyclaceae bacterium]|nr:GyrI-like domain-containing protein [Rhodocyclaceae bacterium]
MISTPQILQTEAQAAAIIPIKAPRSEMVKVFGPAVAELMAALAAQDLVPDGAVFAHHVKMSPDFFEFELGVRIAAPFAATGRVRPGQLPAARVAHTIYSGPYEGLSSAWGEFDTWITSNGHEKAADLWEVYSVGPHSTPDPTGWRTELVRPLVEV